MAAALEWRRDRPAEAARARRRAGARGSASSRGPSWAALLAELRGGRATRARSRTATKRSSSPGGCATIPSRDRRLRDLRGRRPARRQGRARARLRRGADEPGRFVWIGLYEPTEEEFDALRREFDLHPLAVEDAIHAHQRPKLEVYDEMVFMVLKTARYVDPTEVIELGEVLVFLGEDFVITVRHGEASSLARRSASARRRPRAAAARARARRCTRSSTASSTTTSPPSTGSRRHRRGRGGALLGRARQPGRAHLQAPARGARASARRPRRSSSRSTSSPAGTTC